MEIRLAYLAPMVLAGILVSCGGGAPAPADSGAKRIGQAAQTTAGTAGAQHRRPTMPSESPTGRVSTAGSARSTPTNSDARAATAEVTFELVVLGDLPPRASIFWFTRQTHDGQWPSGPAPFPFCGPGGKEHSTTGKACAGEGTVYTNTVTVEPEELLHYSYGATGLERGRTIGALDTRKFTTDSTIRVYGNLPMVPVGKTGTYRLGAAREVGGLTIGETLPRSGRSPVYIQVGYGDAVNQMVALTCDRPSFTDLFVGEEVRWRSRVFLDCSAARQQVTVSNESPQPVGVHFIAIRSQDD